VKNSNREISRSCGIESSTVSDYLQRAKRAKIEWPPPEGLTEQVLEEALFPPPPATGTERMILDFTEVHKELKSKKHVTLNLLWQEYKEHPPEGYQYSWFCEHYRLWTGKLDLAMLHGHRAGEKLFVDYAGQTFDIIDRHSGEISSAQIFVAVLGASNYT